MNSPAVHSNADYFLKRHKFWELWTM